MQPSAKKSCAQLYDPDNAGNSYFCNPYQTDYEQYELEYLDRNSHEQDDIECVVILGYN